MKPKKILKPKDLQKQVEKTELEQLNDELKTFNKKQRINDLTAIIIIWIVLFLMFFLLYL